MDQLGTIWSLFQALFLEATPFLVLGIAISTLARRYLPGGEVLQRLPSHPLLGPLTGAALGFALPACECGNVPVARRLLAAGAPMPTGLGFLFAAPVLNPIVIAGTWAAFPDRPWLLLARPLGALLLALALAGLLRFMAEPDLLAASLLAERRLHLPRQQVSLLEAGGGWLGGAPAPPPPLAPAGRERPSWRDTLRHALDELLELGVLLVMGCLIAAALQSLLPRQWLLAVGQAPTLSILALMLLTVIISVCSSVDAFLALGFAAQITPGALLAFLVLGPIVDIKALGLYSAIFRGPALGLVVLCSCVIVLLMGQWLNLIAL
ncbi:permease [Synechococcus sp. RSCCF101]|uniref:permease n=1 Tax=Synechococcus sp. RSCCF101 TaxID=2511069 RepID=UPI001246BEC6|nr:permease [Synechococcus sp. RSCCF101]QEY33508.1 permease [Synechococcus sp. RSCCF101]